MTEWKNDEKLSTAWIDYTLERETSLSEICVKLSGWRTTRYPLEIFVEGKKVWSGHTEQNLGYYTIRFEPVRGKNVMIRLTGKSKEEDAFKSIVEVDRKVDLNLFRNHTDPDARGLLRIVEIEFYEPAL